jgi:hypothetical protein
VSKRIRLNIVFDHFSITSLRRVRQRIMPIVFFDNFTEISSLFEEGENTIKVKNYVGRLRSVE